MTRSANFVPLTVPTDIFQPARSYNFFTEQTAVFLPEKNRPLCNSAKLQNPFIVPQNLFPAFAEIPRIIGTMPANQVGIGFRNYLRVIFRKRFQSRRHVFGKFSAVAFPHKKFRAKPVVGTNFYKIVMHDIMPLVHILQTSSPVRKP